MKQNLQIFLVLLIAFALLIVLSGCIQQIPKCGDGVCEKGIEDNPQLSTYCAQDCPLIPKPPLEKMQSKIFTSDKSVQLTNMQSCGEDCVSFDVSATPSINSDFWIQIAEKETQAIVVALVQQDCTAAANKITCKNNSIKQLNQNKIYTFQANIPTSITANTAGPKNQKQIYLAGLENIQAAGEICLDCNVNKLDDGKRTLKVNGVEFTGNTDLICSTTSTDIKNMQTWRFIALGKAPKGECKDSFDGLTSPLGKFMIILGTNQPNTLGAWVAEVKPPELPECAGGNVDCDNVVFTLNVKGTAKEIAKTPNLIINFSDDLGEIMYEQAYPQVYGVPYETPLVPRKTSANINTEYDYSIIYPAKYLLPRLLDSKLKYQIIVNGMTQSPIPSESSFFAPPEITANLKAQLLSKLMPIKLIAKFDFKQDPQGFVQEPNPNTSAPTFIQDPTKGLVIKLNNQAGNVDAKWVYNGDRLAITDPTKIYKIKVTIGSDAPQGKTPKINFAINDKSWEVISGMWVLAKPLAYPELSRHPYKDHPQTYEFYLTPPLGTQKWDGGASKELGLAFFFRMFHYDDAKADPNASIWLESLEFYGPEEPS
ncbi:hypothetical protein HZB88_04315, partial [archaeon]|nr:hypothetical protein [archaeon]